MRFHLPLAPALAVVLSLAGCHKASAPPPQAAPAPAPASPMGMAAVQRTAKLAYSHDMQLEMPAESVKPRYERAVRSCLENANCVVLRTSISAGDGSSTLAPSATLTVRLPHDAVTPFEDDLLAPLPGESVGDAILRSSSTSADDLTAVIADVEQRQAQLTDYRDRLRALAQRSDVKVEDLIKIEGELSKTQSELETITARKKTLDQRVDTESLSIGFSAHGRLGGFFDPIVLAWHQAGQVLGQSTATALSFVVAALPWLPIAALVLLFVRLIFGRWRRLPAR